MLQDGHKILRFFRIFFSYKWLKNPVELLQSPVELLYKTEHLLQSPEELLQNPVKLLQNPAELLQNTYKKSMEKSMLMLMYASFLVPHIPPHAKSRDFDGQYLRIASVHCVSWKRGFFACCS